MATKVSPYRQVTVTSSARLHMGFFDLNGAIGRKFGSIGLSLSKPAIALKLKLDKETDTITVPEASREVKQKLDQLCHLLKKDWGLHDPLNIQLVNALPRHAGLGSGTQLALTLGTAIAKLYDLPVTTADIALATGRGGRSGIGIAAFDQGGILIDGGQRQEQQQNKVPPLLARYEFPSAWRILLIEDHAQSGVHGSTESGAFKSLPEFPNAMSEKLSHEVLMKAMPAVVERDLQAFGESVQVLQAVTGDHFAPIQGGRYASKYVTHALNAVEKLGVACFGQSSWGPTGFAIVESEAAASSIIQALKTELDHLPLSLQLTNANNVGAKVLVEDIEE